MYCNGCGKTMQDDASFCSYCGRHVDMAKALPRKLMRPREGRVLAGVCRALAQYFEIDVVIIRLVWVLVLLMGGTGLLAYIIAWIVIPSEPEGLPIAPGAQGMQSS